MLNQFKNFDADRLQLDDLIALAAFGRILRAEYEAHQLEEPDWLDVQLKAIKREIFTRNAAALEARRKEIELRLEGLKTPNQRKQELQKEKAEIDRQLSKIGA